MSIACKFATAGEAKKGNWFSRRHRTAEEHQAARRTREDRKTKQFQAMQERVARQDAVHVAGVPLYSEAGQQAIRKVGL